MSLTSEQCHLHDLREPCHVCQGERIAQLEATISRMSAQNAESGKQLAEVLRENARLTAELAKERHVRETAERESLHHAERTAQLYLERDALATQLAEYSGFGGNNEADSKLRQHCIALEAEVSRLTAANKRLPEERELRFMAQRERDTLATQLAESRKLLDISMAACTFCKETSDALATRCRELEASLASVAEHITGSDFEAALDAAIKRALAASEPSTPCPGALDCLGCKDCEPSK